ncbi:UDP-2,4-diacetamido-2,4,6-trideoxy-beta-L-altropyranose hydrolase [Bacillus thuringiensis]|uniref:cytidylyltransferase domain-containing protein n=1 Tax=Bacillus cereus group TaxID=86661 RepID=UPI0001A0D345|nr:MULTISPECIES: glycosyltransferase [Bacillus cereus group]OUA64031.1 UDP-2,4-diacetamido-2,4,6-trideoxy-beta-L-altropyranose hydrolase [Bacillus thuringiensis serovar thailandensis]HDR7524096.1 UDP-2,4-diacetamido-2,4,6-trideoxy-beta-L-altropyranose hydrolase [Bacillus paranthracis]EEL62335.1 Cytidylyltransferase domain protein [Bacillus cereus F65185]MBE5096322.1 UDP-2,4-diacetamido-2,4,6-trideoxy-beta-L-altropyranose hydrolase [Bacillus thuringiensis]MDA1591850.1 glycosyltransferase [Bacil
MNKQKVVAIIPARGGSKGIPRKNIRLLNGKPLISYAIEVAKKSNLIDKVVVSTDDIEIGNIAKKYGAEVIMRPDHISSDEVPLDPVIHYTVEKIEEELDESYDIVVTVQPTSPLLSIFTLENVIQKIIKENYDTVLTGLDDRHLSWKLEQDKFVPNFKERKNRQYLPSEFRESGAVFATKRKCITPNNRMGENITIYVVGSEESIDIDSYTDWWVAEKLLKRKKLIIRVDGYREIGLGHIYRTLTLAHNIFDHEVIFLMDKQYDLGIKLIEKQNFKIEFFEQDPLPKIREISPDIIINDILDTSTDYMLKLKNMGIKVFNFEDLGPGAEYADGVFNALYPGNVPVKYFYTGENYYCARPDFINSSTKIIKEHVNKVLITFGGTDPNNLTKKTLDAIVNMPYEFEITVVLGPGYKYKDAIFKDIDNYSRVINVYTEINNMAEFMLEADVIFSSAGRTMYEIAMIGTPAIIISQNYRELTHLFGHNYNGFINLGIHHEAREDIIQQSLERLIRDEQLRQMMNNRMLQHDLKRGIERVLSIIFN